MIAKLNKFSLAGICLLFWGTHCYNFREFSIMLQLSSKDSLRIAFKLASESRQADSVSMFCFFTLIADKPTMFEIF